MKKRLFRRSRDKIVGGVCSGLADYANVDVTLIRLITLFGVIASGIFPGLFLYLLCIIIIPLDVNAEWNRGEGNSNSSDYGDRSYDDFQSDGGNADSSKNTRHIVGLCLIIIGVFLISRMFFGWIRWEYVFAALLIIGGLYMIFGNRRNG